MALALSVLKLEYARRRNEIGEGSTGPDLAARTQQRGNEMSLRNLKRDFRGYEHDPHTEVGDGWGVEAVNPSRKTSRRVTSAADAESFVRVDVTSCAPPPRS